MEAANLFGTDGIRGRVGDFPICPEIFHRLAAAVERLLRSKNLPLRIAIGRDGRRSGDNLFRWLLAGFSDAVEVFDLGVVATPVVSFAVPHRQLSAGIALTASHNGAADNGFKLFDRNGFKTSIGDEKFIQNWVAMENLIPACPAHPAVYDIHSQIIADYALHFEMDLRRLPPARGRIVLDMANGAACEYGQRLLERIGLEVITIGNQPDGDNINEGCGSEHGEVLAVRVLESGAMAGLALDGDGDRALLVDGRGQIVAGEYLLAALAMELYPQDRAVVTTVQSNGGLDRFLAGHGWEVHRVAVGDRNVSDELLRRQLHFGGEPSGHFIDLGFNCVSDGLHSGAQMIALFGPRLAAPFEPFPLLPSASCSLPVATKVPIESLHPFVELRDRFAARNARILVRYSGTEPKVRFLVEADTSDLAAAQLTDLVEAWHRSLA